MATLWRYCAARFLQAFAAALLVLALLAAGVDMLLHWGDAAQAADGFAAALRARLMQSAARYLAYLLPAASFAGAFIAVGQAARARETFALRAGGIPPLRAFAPILALAALISLAALPLAESLGAQAHGAMATGAPAAARGESVQLHTGVLWHQSGRVVYSGSRPNAAGTRLHNARIFERDAEGRLLRSIHAESARRLGPSRWRFRNAVVRRFNPLQPAAPPQTARAARITLALASARTLRLTRGELQALPLPALLSHIRNTRQVAGGGAPLWRAQALSVLHFRLSVAALPFLFALAALPAALAVERTRSFALPLLQGAGLLTGFVLLREYGAGIAFHGGGLAPLLPWAAAALLALFACLWLRRAPR